MTARTLILVFFACATAAAAPQTAREHFDEGERLFKRDLLADAEAAYLVAVSDPRLRAPASERLLSIYPRLGRYDRAVKLALQYREYLRGQPRPPELRTRQLALQLGDYYLRLGHYRTGMAYIDESLAPGPAPLPGTQRLSANALRAASLERLRRPKAAAPVWEEVEKAATRLLAGGASPLEPAERMECVRNLADAHRHRGRIPEAISTLTELLELQAERAGPIGRRDTLQQLADLFAQREEWARAYRCLLGATDAHAEAGSPDRLTAGDFCRDLAPLAERLGRPDRAKRLRERAVAHYLAVRRDPSAGRPGEGNALAAYWRLHQFYQENNQLDMALSLSQAQEQSAGQLLMARLRSEQGQLQTVRGSYAKARDLLRHAVADLEKQRPVNLIDLPRALNNLAIVEHATDRSDLAEKLARRTLALYREEDLPADLVKVEAFALVGTCLSQSGEYAHAIEQFRLGVELCKQLGTPADRQLAGLLLNQALLHKTQGDMPNALSACSQALEVFKRFAPPDDPGFANFEVAQASLCVAQGRIAEGAALAKKVLARCERLEIGGVVKASALHYLALDLLMRRDIARAEKTWTAVRRAQEEQKQAALIPRTLNYLGLAAELAKRPEDAEKLYLEALTLQKDAKQAFPATHFITLWRLAGLLERRGEAPRARELLNKAIDIAESVRLRTYGDAQQRAGYLAQFAPAFEQLVQSHLAAGDVESALLALDRGRSRTLLDQLQNSNVDPLAGVPGEAGKALREREAGLKRTITAIRARAQLLPTDSLDDARVKKLVAELDRAQEEYAEVWREVYNANPVYRRLVTKTTSAELLKTLRKKTLGPGTVLLAYHVGSGGSHVLLVGGEGVKPEAYPLQVASDLSERVVGPPSVSAHGEGTRGLRLRERKHDKPPPAPTGAVAAVRNVPLTAPVARALVDTYWEQIADPDFRPTRGLRLRTREASSPVPVQRIELLGDMMMPQALRKRLAELKATTIVIIPDGPLHKLPLEAMLVRSGDKTRYLLEELPPVVYAPSASVLALLAERPTPVRKGPPSLVTLSNPAYPQAKGAAAGSGKRDAFSVLGMRGELPPLPSTADEAREIRRHFAPKDVVALEGRTATEKAFTSAVAGRSFLHIAAHGFADERFGNLFGALALAPPPAGKETDSDDGFLSLHEIYRLPLGDCELAVLSACSTNVGPQRPLEAGVTLASGFLAAGARHVIASHWNVDDRSTADLIGGFFTAVMERDGDRDHARALREARLAILRRPEYASPFHWAPFVLIGSPAAAAGGGAVGGAKTSPPRPRSWGEQGRAAGSGVQPEDIDAVPGGVVDLAGG